MGTGEHVQLHGVQPPTAYPLDYVVIHVTQESYSKTVSIFQNPQKMVSAHYLVRSADGHVAQCVRERDVAWHAGNWDYNTRSIGIEHEGWVDQPPISPTRCTRSRPG